SERRMYLLYQVGGILSCSFLPSFLFFFFFTHPAPSNIYTLSLHDALPIFSSKYESYSVLSASMKAKSNISPRSRFFRVAMAGPRDRKSTRLNSSHLGISYAVFCLKKKRTHPGRPSRRNRNCIPPALRCRRR